jgi:hypothetical protein
LKFETKSKMKESGDKKHKDLGGLTLKALCPPYTKPK